MTVRLWYDRPELCEWDAVVMKATGQDVVLDRSAFFPGGGGQPPDRGTL